MNNLKLQACIGFGGRVKQGLQVHPDREHLLYPLGCQLIVEKISGKKSQSFLSGHDDDITALTVSASGNWIVSGQRNRNGREASIIVWDFRKREPVHIFSLHRQHIQGLAVSPNDRYLVSLGGPDDSTVALWDLDSGKPVASSPTSNGKSGFAIAVAYSPHSDNTFIVGGENMFRFWDFDVDTGKLSATDCGVRGLKRTVTSIGTHVKSDAAYFGTTSGDVIEMNMNSRNLVSVGPTRTSNFELGVQSVVVVENCDLIVGAGDGTVALVNPRTWKVTRKKKVKGSITSVAVRGAGHEFFVGTSLSNIFRFGHANFAFTSRLSAHSASVKDICFPKDCPDLFGTCGGNEIRIWISATNKVALNINVDIQETCNCMAIHGSGTLIISGWSDGAVRAFLPESGRKLFETANAQKGGVTSLVMLGGDGKFATGGSDGQVKIWQITSGGKQTQLIATLKEHSAKVTSLQVNNNDEELISSSEDGSCIIWNLQSFKRSQILLGNTLFKQIKYSADEAQVVTVGTDRKVGWWEVYDGALIRDVTMSSNGSVNSIDVSRDGAKLFTAGEDRKIRVVDYKTADELNVGVGHGASITKVKLDPSQSRIISVSDDGGICKWAL